MSRIADYIAWARANVPADPTGACLEVTLLMAAAFPELRRVRGHYHDASGTYPHWWLVTKDGAVVDPTSGQFPSLGGGEYVEHIEGDPEPTGKCLDCGGYTYNGDTFCSPECERATAAYMKRVVGGRA